jgi:predicted nucleic acid-binding protein
LRTFVDTSALYAILDRTDPDHARARAELERLAGEPLFTHNYVVLETAELVERRLGRPVARSFLVDLLAPVEIVYVEETVHAAAASAYVAGDTNAPSLVDFTSFEVMRDAGIRRALAIDRRFSAAGFEVLPG